MSLIPESDVSLRKELRAPILEGSLPSWATSTVSGSGTVTVNDASTGGGYWELSGSSGDTAIVETTLNFDITEYDVIEVETEFSVDSMSRFFHGLDSGSGASARLDGTQYRKLRVEDTNGNVTDNGDISAVDTRPGRFVETVRVNTVTGETEAYLNGAKLTPTASTPPTSETYIGKWAIIDATTVRVHSAAIRYYDVLTA